MGEIYLKLIHMKTRFDYSNLRICVDNIEDFEVVKKVIEDIGENESWETYL